MRPREEIERVNALLDGLSDGEFRELCIEALRVWRRQPPQSLILSSHGALGRYLLPLLAERKAVPLNGIEVDALKEVFQIGAGEPSAPMTGVIEFMDWFARAGFAHPLSLDSWRLTRYGVAFLAAAGDHPLAPGFVQRLCNRCPNLPDPVTALLVDSRTCLDHMLLRPAAALMGVAYETAVEAVIEALMTKGTLPPTALDCKAWQKIERVREVVKAWPKQTIEQTTRRSSALAACDFADRLRDRRNDASHTTPRYGFDDREEIEELLVSAGRNLPGLWSAAS